MRKCARAVLNLKPEFLLLGGVVKQTLGFMVFLIFPLTEWVILSFQTKRMPR